MTSLENSGLDATELRDPMDDRIRFPESDISGGENIILRPGSDPPGAGNVAAKCLDLLQVWASRFVMLLKLPCRDTATVVDALTKNIRKLPGRLHRSLTWDRGKEMAAHWAFTVATDVRRDFTAKA